VVAATEGLSQAELARAADEAAKGAVLSDRERISSNALLAAVAERRTAAL